MRVSINNKFIYLSHGKTGSTTVRAALDRYCDPLPGDMKDLSGTYKNSLGNHPSARDVKQFFDEHGLSWDDYFKFTFVRNPWDRVVSGYFYFKNHPNPPTPYGQERKKLANENTFEWWVKNVIDSKNSQYHGIHDGQNMLVDYIGKTETLQQDLDIILDKLHLPRVAVQCLNNSSHKHYTEYYDIKTAICVHNIFREDVDYFGYKFGQ